MKTVILYRRDFALKIIWVDLINAAIASGKLPKGTNPESDDIAITVKIISAD